MQSATHRISLDIHDTASQATVSVKKGDSKRTIMATLTECGKPYPLDADCTAVIRFKKPDGTVVYSDCSVGFSGIICHLTTQATSVVGSVGCEITIYGTDNKQITSPRFEMIVDDTVYSDSEVESSNEFTALSKAMSQFGGISGATQRAEEAAASASSYKENAEISATMAEISKESALSYSNAAASSAETAATAATNAASSETAAETAKAGAETAAASAATDAGNAGESANAAKTYKEAAETAAATATEKAAAAENSAASMRMKLIRKITTTEAVSSVVISTDEEGNAISLDRFCLILTLPSAVSVSTGGIVIQCNGTTTSHYAYYHTNTASVKHARFDGECMGDTTGADGAVRHWLINSALGTAQSYGNTLKTERYMFAVPTINKLTFKMALPSGAVLVLYGRSGG